MSTFLEITERLSRLLEQHYVLPGNVPDIVARLTYLNQPTGQGSDDVLVTQLNGALQRASGDHHLRVRPKPSPAEVGEGSDWKHRMVRESVDNAGGIRSVTRMENRTTVITIAPYLSSIELARPYVDAAFRLAADTEHLVLDVREGRGGTPETGSSQSRV